MYKPTNFILAVYALTILLNFLKICLKIEDNFLNKTSLFLFPPELTSYI